MLQPNIDTKIEELELPAKLVTRLNICKARTFADIMEIDASEWANVTPKVVNALRHFQNSYKAHYKKLLGEVVDVENNAPQTPNRKNNQANMTPTDDRRFFVANNILNAYASAGRLYRHDRPIQEVMEEIVNATDAFMDAFNGKKAQSTKSRRNKRVDPVVNEDNEATAAEIEPPIGEQSLMDRLIDMVDNRADKTVDSDIVNAESTHPTTTEDDTVAAEVLPTVGQELPAEEDTTPEEVLPTVEQELPAQEDTTPEEVLPTVEQELPAEEDTTPEEVLPTVEQEQAAAEYATETENAHIAEELPEEEMPIAPNINPLQVDEVVTLPVAEEVPAQEDPAHPTVQPGNIIVLTAYHGRRPSTSRNFQLGSIIKIENSHIDQTGILQLRGFCGRKPANIDASRWDWALCHDMEEAQALSSTIAAPTAQSRPTVAPVQPVDTEVPAIENPVELATTAPVEDKELPQPVGDTELPQQPVQASQATTVDSVEVSVPAPSEEAPSVNVEEEPSAKVEEEPSVKVEEEPPVKVEEVPSVEVEEEPSEKVEEEPSVKVEEEPSVKVEEEPSVKVEEEPSIKAEEPAKTDEYPAQSRKHDMSGVPQLFDLFLTEEEENAELPF